MKLPLRKMGITAVLAVTLIGGTAAMALVQLTEPAANAAQGEARFTPGDDAALMRLVKQGGGLRCGWIWDVSKDTLNIAGPDTGSVYFAQPYLMSPGDEITIHGYYPNARYFSLITYGADGLPINDASLRDKAIVPDPGSLNPFATPNVPNPLDQRYTVRIVPTLPSPTPPNTLAGLTPGTTEAVGFLVYRLYVPQPDGDIKASVPLPRLTVNGKTLRNCTVAEQRVYNKVLAPLANYLVTKSAPDPDTVTRGADLYRRLGSAAGLFPNPDNQYLAAANDYEAGRVIVVRAKGFTFPNTVAGESVLEPTQVRYWSFCSNELANPYPAVQCAADYQIPLDDDGYYTIAISMPDDRPSNATAENGVTWLAWAEPPFNDNVIPPNTSYLRTMLPAPDFNQAVQAVPQPVQGSTPEENKAAAQAAMGEYYPVGVLCSKAQFEAGGPSSCFGP